MRIVAVAVLVLGALLAVDVGGAEAQLDDDFKLKGSGEDFQVNHQRWVINGRIILARQRFREAIALIEAGPNAEEARFAFILAQNGYKLLRGAQGSVEHIVKLSRFPDPLLPLLAHHIQQARNAYLAAEMQLSGGLTDPTRLALSRQYLEAAAVRTEAIIEAYVR